jgi:hypothetical protein
MLNLPWRSGVLNAQGWGKEPNSQYQTLSDAPESTKAENRERHKG